MRRRLHVRAPGPWLCRGKFLPTAASTARALALVLCALFMGLSAKAAQAAEPGRFLAEHLSVELAAVGGWRVSWADERNPGFHIGGGGGEVNIGLELENGLGFLIGGRVLFERHLTQETPQSGTYADMLGQVLAQLRFSDWVRVGLGATAGRLWRCCGAEVESSATSALLFGGFLRVGVDFLPRASLPRALSLWLRMEVDGHKPEDAMSLLPAVSLNLAVGIGLRL